MTPDPDPQAPLFAPTVRKDAAELRDQIEQCVNSPIALAVLEALDGLVVVLNADRQILAVNDTLLEALQREGAVKPWGQRWGEVNHCVHADEGPDGCGTSRACRHCGAALAILAAQESHLPVTGECRMSIRHNGQWEAREFQLRVTPLALPWGEVLVPVFHDVSDSHRREILESAFLHDLAGTLSALTCWSDMMKLGTVDPEAAAGRIAAIAGQLSEVVAHQRLVLRAERGELPMEARPVAPEDVLRALGDLLRASPAALAKGLAIDPGSGGATPVVTDPTLLHRILGNMGLNALEAAQPGETVTLGFTLDDAPRFWVRNPGCIPEEVAAHIFERSFSTKAKAGRGLGTYAMKVLGENVLGGQVGFRSSEAEGTEFFIRLAM